MTNLYYQYLESQSEEKGEKKKKKKKEKGMTVQELINRLTSYPQDLEVIFAGFYDNGYGWVVNKDPLFLRYPDRLDIIIDEDGE